MKKIFSSLVVIALLSTPIITKADTVIQNSVSVTANGGISTTKVKTVHNGEVIEDIDISTTTPFHYQSKYDSDGVRISVDTDQSDQITQLNSLLNQLRNLLALYEKLLAKQNIQ